MFPQRQGRVGVDVRSPNSYLLLFSTGPGQSSVPAPVLVTSSALESSLPPPISAFRGIPPPIPGNANAQRNASMSRHRRPPHPFPSTSSSPSGGAKLRVEIMFWPNVVSFSSHSHLLSSECGTLVGFWYP